MGFIDRRRYDREPRTGEWRDAKPPAPGDSFFEYMGEPEQQRVRRRREVIYNPDGSVHAERDTLDLEQQKAVGSFKPGCYRNRRNVGERVAEAFYAIVVLALWGVGLMVLAALGHLSAPDSYGFEKAIGVYFLFTLVLMVIGACRNE